jgi:hypothetical protein
MRECPRGRCPNRTGRGIGTRGSPGDRVAEAPDEAHAHTANDSAASTSIGMATNFMASMVTDRPRNRHRREAYFA